MKHHRDSRSNKRSIVLLLLAATLSLQIGCSDGLNSSESSQLNDVAQLTVYQLTPDGRETLGLYRFDLAAGLTESDQPVLIEQLEASLHSSVPAGSVKPEDFQPDYAVAAGVMVIAIDFDLGVAEIDHDGNKRLVKAKSDVRDSLKTIAEGRTITGR